MINNRYILGEQLFGEPGIGELFRARDTLAVQNGALPQVLIHCISSAEMGYAEYCRIRDQLMQLGAGDVRNQNSQNSLVLGVLDSGWTGEKGYFVLEAPETWSINVLPPISVVPTSLHKRADKWVRGLRKQKLVNGGLEPSFFLVTSNGDLYLPGTALNTFIQKLQSGSGLVSGNVSQHHTKTDTGVLKWLGWSLLTFGSVTLAGGAYINRETISAQFPLLFSDKVASVQPATTDSGSVDPLSVESLVESLPEKTASQQKPKIMITLADQQISPVVVTQTSKEPEKIVVGGVVNETGFLAEENKSAFIASSTTPEAPDFQPSEAAIESESVSSENTDIQPSSELTAAPDEATVGVMTAPTAYESELVGQDSGSAEAFIQLAEISNRAIGPEVEDTPAIKAIVSEPISKPVNNPVDAKQISQKEVKPVRAAVSWNGMSEEKVLRRAEQALNNGRLQSALYYLRALWRQGLKDGELLVMVEKVAADQQAKAKLSLAQGEVREAKVAVKQAARLIGEFGLTDLVEVQKQLESDLPVR